MPSSFGRPPVVCCRGTRPSHAAISRPSRNCEASPTAATSAVAAFSPTPGIVASRRVHDALGEEWSIVEDSGRCCEGIDQWSKVVLLSRYTGESTAVYERPSEPPLAKNR